ncbi:hypothetical protein FJV41_30235 [Myxococcus llanfairpwllgwyngyllgogerychwyrndrobwllllantysiliogogogochensis]|uniref:ADYC domain-containing protein n=1 Tax=Myxococcus llanfairpwllgwyngyllgogerychwyrndrobwllllantysiliogogogochensis TaxID=2590453 RepID=A0A540WT64_9BACT|nr:ADYC domain-containing protein [Myxococcus llanfairpwllgwyngyllgogerychwyrndrobwllllantysiliogogogochensis]TQF12205.1 hypothetical protein FJV41_30235 [Myxococcus llanfairpwllgwyngyllgogerychwyrndrobwllllantysiliogogogochensis]
MARDLLRVCSAMNAKACLLSALILSACGPVMEVRDPEPFVASSARALGTLQGKTPQGKTPQGKTPQGTKTHNPWAVVVDSFHVRDSNGALVSAKAQLNGSHLLGIATSGGQGLPVPPPSPFPRLPKQASSRAVDFPVGFEVTTVPLATFSVVEISGLLASPRALDSEPRRDARIVGSFVDAGPYGPTDAANLLQPQYRRATGPNADVRFYRVQIKDDGGTWVDFCERGDGSPSNAAMFLSRYLDTMGHANSAEDQYLGIACHDGTAVKCARWGYKPWTRLIPPNQHEPVSLEPFWEACYKAAMADYCENGVSHTEPDTLIDIWDRHHFIAPTSEDDVFDDPAGANGPSAFTVESAFNARGTVCLEKERFVALPANCATMDVEVVVTGGPFCVESNEPTSPSSCSPVTRRGPSLIFNKGELQECVQQAESEQDVPLIFVANWTNGCLHSPYVVGPALANDCNWLTRAVCEQPLFKGCCSEAPDGKMRPYDWSAQCVALAESLSLEPIIVPPTGGVITP